MNESAGLLAGEGGRFLRVLDGVDVLALLLEVVEKSVLVPLVGDQPERGSQRQGIVVDRAVLEGDVTATLHREVEVHAFADPVVELIAADPNVSGDLAVAVGFVVEQRSISRGDLVLLLLLQLIADEVRRLVLAHPELGVVALQLGGHRIQQDEAGIRRRACAEKKEKDWEEADDSSDRGGMPPSRLVLRRRAWKACRSPARP